MPSVIFTPEVVAVLTAAILKGNTVRNACALAGVHYNYYTNSMRAGKKLLEATMDMSEEERRRVLADSVNPEMERFEVYLYRQVRAAEASLEDSLVETWYNLRHTDWKSAKEFLARRFPKDWAEVSTKNLNISGPNGGPVQITNMDLSKLSTEELEKFEQLLSKIPQSGDDTDGES